MKDFQITWIHEPVQDILDIITLEESCGKFCREKTSTTCGTDCTNYNE